MFCLPSNLEDPYFVKAEITESKFLAAVNTCLLNCFEFYIIYSNICNHFSMLEFLFEDVPVS